MKISLFKRFNNAIRQGISCAGVITIRGLFFWVSGATQRAFYIGSLYGYLNHTSEPKREVLQRVASRMKLGEKEVVLELPAVIHSVLWYGEDLDHAINEACQGKDVKQALQDPTVREHLKGLFIERCPDWFRYGRAADMRNDLDLLLDPDLVLQ